MHVYFTIGICMLGAVIAPDPCDPACKQELKALQTFLFNEIPNIVLQDGKGLQNMHTTARQRLITFFVKKYEEIVPAHWGDADTEKKKEGIRRTVSGAIHENMVESVFKILEATLDWQVPSHLSNITRIRELNDVIRGLADVKCGYVGDKCRGDLLLDCFTKRMEAGLVTTNVLDFEDAVIAGNFDVDTTKILNGLRDLVKNSAGIPLSEFEKTLSTCTLRFSETPITFLSLARGTVMSRMGFFKVFNGQFRAVVDPAEVTKYSSFLFFFKLKREKQDLWSLLHSLRSFGIPRSGIEIPNPKDWMEKLTNDDIAVHQITCDNYAFFGEVRVKKDKEELGYHCNEFIFNKAGGAIKEAADEERKQTLQYKNVAKLEQINEFVTDPVAAVKKILKIPDLDLKDIALPVIDAEVKKVLSPIGLKPPLINDIMASPANRHTLLSLTSKQYADGTSLKTTFTESSWSKAHPNFGKGYALASFNVNLVLGMLGPLVEGDPTKTLILQGIQVLVGIVDLGVAIATGDVFGIVMGVINLVLNVAKFLIQALNLCECRTINPNYEENGIATSERRETFCGEVGKVVNGVIGFFTSWIPGRRRRRRSIKEIARSIDLERRGFTGKPWLGDQHVIKQVTIEKPIKPWRMIEDGVRRPLVQAYETRTSVNIDKARQIVTDIYLVGEKYKKIVQDEP